MVASGQIISNHMARSWGGLPLALQQHTDGDFVKRIFTLDGLKGLVGLRKAYVLQACLHAFEGRINMTRQQLEKLVSVHTNVFEQMDGLCGVGVAEADTLSTAYGTAFNALLTKGTIAIQEVTEDASSNSSPTQQRVVQKEKKNHTAADGQQLAGGRLVSLAQISHLTCGHDADENNREPGYPGILFSTESLHELRLLLSVDMMMQSRSCVVASHGQSHAGYNVNVVVLTL